MADELARWVRGLGARMVEVTQNVEDSPLSVPQFPRQKTRLTVEDLPFETIRLEVNGRPFYVVLRDEKVYMSYRTSSGTMCIKRVKPRGAKETALELARLIHHQGREWPDRNIALACNWPNVVAPPLTLVALRTAARDSSRPPAMKQARSPWSSRGSPVSAGAIQTEVTLAMLPHDAVEVRAANRICYVLLTQNVVFMRMESWNASTAYLREITDAARKKRLIAMAEEQVANGGRVRRFSSF